MTALRANTASLPAGGGAFALPELTVGVFLTDQPTHRLAVGRDRATHVPLQRHDGWILPKQAEGLCEYDAPLDVVTVSIPEPMLRDAGLRTDPSALAPLVGPLDPLMVQMVLQAEAFGRGGTLYAQTMAHALAAQMARTLQPAEPVAATVDDVRLRRAIEHIRAHLSDDLSLNEMAGVAAMSASHFARAFKRATGTSPLQFVIAERLEMAMALLRTTQLTVSEVAFRVGYADLPRFGQHFKRRFGRTPGAARDG